MEYTIEIRRRGELIWIDNQLSKENAISIRNRFWDDSVLRKNYEVIFHRTYTCDY